MKIKLIFAWYDLWVGFFYDKKKRWLYFFPIPTVGIIFKRRWKCYDCGKKLDYGDVRFYTSSMPLCYECNHHANICDEECR